MRHLINTAVRHGLHAYHTMCHHSSVWDGCIQAAAHLHSAVSPVLRMHGLNTRQLDKTLKTSYDHYEFYARQARDCIQVMDSVAAHLRGYPYNM